MKKNTQEKSLIQVNQNNIFYRMKKFLKNIFTRKDKFLNTMIVEDKVNDATDNKKKSFMESLKNIESEETKLLELQKRYRNGDIKEEELSEEQVNSLCELYDKQIANLKESNEKRKQKLLQYRKNYK